MKLRVLCNFLTISGVALFSYSSASGQTVDAVEDAADKTKNATEKLPKEQKIQPLMPLKKRAVIRSNWLITSKVKRTRAANG